MCGGMRSTYPLKNSIAKRPERLCQTGWNHSSLRNHASDLLDVVFNPGMENPITFDYENQDGTIDQSINKASDVNNNGAIGMEEAIYVLQHISTMR